MHKRAKQTNWKRAKNNNLHLSSHIHRNTRKSRQRLGFPCFRPSLGRQTKVVITGRWWTVFSGRASERASGAIQISPGYHLMLAHSHREGRLFTPTWAKLPRAMSAAAADNTATHWLIHIDDDVWRNNNDDDDEIHFSSVARDCCFLCAVVNGANTQFEVAPPFWVGRRQVWLQQRGTRASCDSMQFSLSLAGCSESSKVLRVPEANQWQHNPNAPSTNTLTITHTPSSAVHEWTLNNLRPSKLASTCARQANKNRNGVSSLLCSLARSPSKDSSYWVKSTQTNTTQVWRHHH